MTSPQWSRIAEQVADGVGVSQGARVAVALTGTAPAAIAAVEAFVLEVYRRGGHPQVLLTDAAFDRAAMLHADDETLSRPNPLEMEAMEWADCYVAFRPMTLPAEDTSTPRRRALQRSAMGKVSTARWESTRWCLVRVPTTEWAELVGVDADALFAEFAAGCLDDWAPSRSRWHDLAAAWQDHRQVRITAADTDLSFSIAGRRWAVFAGEANLPDGEIANAPEDHSAQGHIRFEGPFYFGGQRIRDLTLEFAEGQVISARALEGQDTVDALLDTDGGSRRIGEFGIGLNSGMRTMTGDLFFDEKILGTIHLALGRAYPECGGTNRSALHWDIVKDLRDGGSLVLDDEVLIDQGRPVGLLSQATSSQHEGEPA